MQMLKSIIKSVLIFPVVVLRILSLCYSKLIGIIWTDFRSHYKDEYLGWSDSLQRKIEHRKKDGSLVNLSIFAPNSLCDYRADTFSTKEPETLEWIEEYGSLGNLFDIGANVGLYSIYYSKIHSGNVYAFEPSFFNLKLLAKNVHSNGISDRVRIVTAPLSNRNDFADFKLLSTVEGGALSAFGVNFGHDGSVFKTGLNYLTLGFRLDDMFKSNFLREYPAIIKIDVDGIEHIILEGAKEVLARPECKSILIEVNDDFHEQADSVKKILEDCGFSLKEKRHSSILDGGSFEKTFNQIWVK